jgi:hypothetical protein
MKTLYIILLMGSISFNAIAQKIIEKNINFANKEYVKLDIQITDSIRIQTWDKNEVSARASVSINEDKDNDIYLTTFEDSGKGVVISASLKPGDSKETTSTVDDNIYWDIYIPEKADLAVKTINGNLTLAGKTSEINASTVSGFIDMTISSARKANLSLETVTGTIYTNSELEKTEDEHSTGSGIDAQMNGGGVPVTLKSVSGDIYFRVK